MLVSYVLVVLEFGNVAYATATDPFICDGTPYISIGDETELRKVENNLSVTPMYKLYGDILVNGIGYNILDNYIYAQVAGEQNASDGTALASNDLIKIASDGNWTNLGKPSSGTYDPRQHNGTMDSKGNYYAVEQSGEHLYKVSIGTDPADNTNITSTEIALTKPDGTVNDVKATDWTFNVSTGNLYGINGGKLREINIESGVVNPNIPLASGSDPMPDNCGGAWSNAKGEMYFYDNGDGGLYKVVIEKDGNATVTKLGSVESNGHFDATACRPPYITKKANTHKVAPGESFVYTFKIYNPFTKAIDVNFTDDLPTELDYDTSTLTTRIDSNGDNAGGDVITFTQD
jgi:hypothetical protein